jgi:hypothetical protein
MRVIACQRTICRFNGHWRTVTPPAPPGREEFIETTGVSFTTLIEAGADTDVRGAPVVIIGGHWREISAEEEEAFVRDGFGDWLGDRRPNVVVGERVLPARVTPERVSIDELETEVAELRAEVEELRKARKGAA